MRDALPPKERNEVTSLCGDHSCRIESNRLDIAFVFSEKTIEGAFWHFKELGDVFFDSNVITSGAGKAKLFDEFDGIYVVLLGGLLRYFVCCILGESPQACLMATSRAVLTKLADNIAHLFPICFCVSRSLSLARAKA